MSRRARADHAETGSPVDRRRRIRRILLAASVLGFLVLGAFHASGHAEPSELPSFLGLVFLVLLIHVLL